MTRQSSRNILLIEPAEFYFNEQTEDSNIYQHDDHESPEEVLQRAVQEFRNYRDCLVEHGVHVVTMKGREGCPDQIFPNWASTYPDGTLTLYPMLTENRRAEREEHIIEFLKNYYTLEHDFRDMEKQGLFMESTASVVMDHVNRKGYAALSSRTTEEMVEKWAAAKGYEVICFPTKTHKENVPVYHTDLIVCIGTTFAIVCAECITDEEKREAVVKSLQEHREVMFLTYEQVANYCGNCLEVRGHNDEPYLVMSLHAQENLTEEQKKFLSKHVTKIIGTHIPTIERYGGGSARCQLMELF